MKNVIIRSLTGIVYIAAIVCGLMLPSPALWVLAVILAIPAAMEFQRLLKADNSSHGFTAMIDVVAVAITASIAVSYNLDKTTGTVMVLLLMAFFILRPVMAIANRQMRASVSSYAAAMASIAYIGLPLLTLTAIAGISPWLALVMFIMIWLNDTGAYCVGCLLGRHKLWPRLSPKKSWEGLIGGLLFSVGFGVALQYIPFDALQLNVDLKGLGMVQLASLGALVSIAATFGDFFESMLKRAAKVKDSGNLLPGHGGVLDRIDSLLLVAPATFMYLLFIL